jgi:hypothetical protein
LKAYCIDGAFASLGGHAQPRGWETKKVLNEIGLDANDVADWLATGTALAI